LRSETWSTRARRAAGHLLTNTIPRRRQGRIRVAENGGRASAAIQNGTSLGVTLFRGAAILPVRIRAAGAGLGVSILLAAAFVLFPGGFRGSGNVAAGALARAGSRNVARAGLSRSRPAGLASARVPVGFFLVFVRSSAAFV